MTKLIKAINNLSAKINYYKLNNEKNISIATQKKNHKLNIHTKKSIEKHGNFVKKISAFAIVKSSPE